MYKIWLKRYLFRKTLVKLFFQLQNCRQQRRQKSLELNHYPNYCNDHRFLQQHGCWKKVIESWKYDFYKNFRILRSFLCNFPIVGLDVLEHFSLSLESTGVINYKFWKALEMTFHSVHSAFLSLEHVKEILGFSSEFPKPEYVIVIFRTILHGWIISIMKTSTNSRCWVKWAFILTLGCLYRRYSVFYNLRTLSIVIRCDLGTMYYLSKISVRILPWDPWLPRCSKNLARSCQDSQDASKRVNPGSY